MMKSRMLVLLLALCASAAFGGCHATHCATGGCGDAWGDYCGGGCSSGGCKDDCPVGGWRMSGCCESGCSRDGGRCGHDCGCTQGGDCCCEGGCGCGHKHGRKRHGCIFGGLFSCCASDWGINFCDLWGWGCGEKYWGPWHNDPPGCDPCDKCGDYADCGMRYVAPQPGYQSKRLMMPHGDGYYHEGHFHDESYYPEGVDAPMYVPGREPTVAPQPRDIVPMEPTPMPMNEPEPLPGPTNGNGTAR